MVKALEMCWLRGESGSAGACRVASWLGLVGAAVAHKGTARTTSGTANSSSDDERSDDSGGANQQQVRQPAQQPVQQAPQLSNSHATTSGS